MVAGIVWFAEYESSSSWPIQTCHSHGNGPKQKKGRFSASRVRRLCWDLVSLPLSGGQGEKGLKTWKLTNKVSRSYPISQPLSLTNGHSALTRENLRVCPSVEDELLSARWLLYTPIHRGDIPGKLRNHTHRENFFLCFASFSLTVRKRLSYKRRTVEKGRTRIHFLLNTKY